MILADYQQYGGHIWETAGLRNILHYLGWIDPGTGLPFTESDLIGIGGGIGAGYFVWEICGGIWVTVGFRDRWQNYKGEFSKTICDRLGVPMQTFDAGGVNAAEKQLLDRLERGIPVLATTSKASMPYLGLPIEFAKGMVHGVVVYGLDEGTAYLADLAPTPVSCTREQLRFARSIITANKNLAVEFGRPSAEPDVPNAMLEGIRHCVNAMQNPPIRNYGLAAWSKWADLVTNPKDKKGWPTLFAKGKQLLGALVSTYRAIEIDESVGGMRPLYAEFLDHAARRLDRPALQACATEYRELGKVWSDFAKSLLPDTIPGFAEAASLTSARRRLFLDQGMGATETIREQFAEISRLERESNKNPPLVGAALASYLADVEKRLRDLSEREERAVANLAKAVA